MLAVQEYYEYLELEQVFGKHKKRGVDINALIQALLSYKLTENHSITKACDWINRKEVLDVFGLEKFSKRTLNRVLEILGANHEEIMADLQDALFESYEFGHTDINMDWTSMVLYGDKCPIAKYGYSRDHRPDKKQINVGLTEISEPVHVPIAMTIREGNINDQVHFDDTFSKVEDRLEKGSLVTFDQGANRKENLDRIEYKNLKYLTARQLNKSDENTWMMNFDKSKAELVDQTYGVYALKRVFPSRYVFMYFSEDLHRRQIKSKLRKVERLYEEAQLLHEAIENNRGLPKRYRINNPLIECEYSYQSKLAKLSEKKARALLEEASITGREGFFCLVSNKDMTPKEALETYRLKDSIEKIFNSIKNELDLMPLRVWSTNSVYGAMVLVFLAQLVISLIRFDHDEVEHVAPKFIKKALMNLTVTVENRKDGSKRYIYSNFSRISEVVLTQFLAIP